MIANYNKKETKNENKEHLQQDKKKESNKKETEQGSSEQRKNMNKKEPQNKVNKEEMNKESNNETKNKEESKIVGNTILKLPKLTPKSTTKTKYKTKKQQEQENKTRMESRNQKSLKSYFEKQAAENKEKQQQIKQITEIKLKTTRINNPNLAEQEQETILTTKNEQTNRQEVKNDSNLAASAVKITPTLSVKVLGKNVTDLMTLKSFLARKKSERDSKQAQIRRPSSANSDSSQSNAAMYAHSGENNLQNS